MGVHTSVGHVPVLYVNCANIWGPSDHSWRLHRPKPWGGGGALIDQKSKVKVVKEF